jgi:hypothetical protein
MDDQFFGKRIYDHVHLLQRNDTEQDFIRARNNESVATRESIFEVNINGTNVITFAIGTVC